MRALIFDLDGTLVDTVYAHVFAWQQALAEAGMAIPGWLILVESHDGGLSRGRSRANSARPHEDEMQALSAARGALCAALLFEGRCRSDGAARSTRDRDHLRIATSVDGSDRCFAVALGSVMRRRR